jgi:signal transduction histidine kinase
MKLLPDSIKTRTILVLLIGLTVSHIGSTLVYSSDRDQPLTAANEQLFADKLATIAQVIDTSPEDLRPRVADAVSSPRLAVAWQRTSSVPADHAEDGRFALIQDSMQLHFGPLAHDRLHVVASPVPHQGAAWPRWAAHLLHGLPSEERLHVSVNLRDGTWVDLSLAMPGAMSRWSWNAILSTLVMVIATLVIAAWATRWITAPLSSFALAAERLGMDVTAPPLAEDGPKEVRAAARAFNQMQQRIRSFVEDRLQMLAAISHDLRSPITRLRLRAEQLPIDPAQQERMLADLDQMEQMVAANLNFVRDEASAEPGQAIDLAALLEAICDEAADLGQDAEFDWPGRLVFHGRPSALRRLFSNLIDNAVRYGGQARVKAVASDRAVDILVEDDGPGIPQPQLETVFKPFYRLERSRNQRTGGVGLGLANARTIARAHGGDVRLENRLEGGLRAIVTLPRNDVTKTEG